MEKLPQLLMRHPDISTLPPLILPEGFSVHTHADRTDNVWESIIDDAFGKHFSFDSFIRHGGGYQPEYVLYISRNGTDIATTTAIENEKYPGEGWLRMVAVSSQARGMGVGKLITLAALHSLAERGYKSVLLSTDDRRLPAISLYLSVGFKPIYTHESHEQRWKNVFASLNGRNT